ncbi:MAG: aldolase/citrate lyase family protein [Candidatus Neomarinimicrobiota bacterium]
MNTIGSAGNYGKDDRSDCAVEIIRTSCGGIVVELNSKVGKLYGDSIEELCREEMSFFGISDAHVKIDDSGALPYILTARIEAALKQIIETDREFLPEMLPENRYSTEKDRPRRSRLYLPGNTPKLAINAGLHSPDGIILDLEDSIAPAKKEEARYLVRNTLRALNFYGAERMVRINQIPQGLDDLKFIIPHNVNLILVPKCESADQIHVLEKEIIKISVAFGVTQPIFLMPIIESALGVVNATEIATSSPNVVALAVGLEDYTADLGIQRTKEGHETFFARCQIVNAAKATGIQAIDSVFSDVADMDALKQVVLESKSLGFDGMGCIHPRQIPAIHKNYAPNPDEIMKAKKIINAYFDAAEKGLGVVALGSKMIDAPVVKRAQRTIANAIESGKLSADWRSEDVK